MNKPIFLLSFLLTATVSLVAQYNYVPNGSFEQQTSCPQTEGELEKSIGWIRPNPNTTDYVCSCAPLLGGVSAPNYFMGYQQPFEGECYVGIAGYAHSQPMVAEYAQCKLNARLNPGYRYRVSMRVALSNHSDYTINNFGIAITTNQLSNSGATAFNVTPQLVASINLTDTVNWTLKTAEFTATGGEEWLTIGRFDFQGMPQIQTAQPDTNPFYPDEYGYYVVDSIWLIDITPFDWTPNIVNIITPNGDGINDDLTIVPLTHWEDWEMNVYNRYGTIVAIINADNQTWSGTHRQNNQPVSDGVYFYELVIRSNEVIIKKGFIHVLK